MPDIRRRPAGADVPGVTAIVHGLPDHFTSDVPGRITSPTPDDHRVL